MKDWVGNSSMRSCNSRSSFAEKYDYYATDPKALELLLELETFSPYVWECACGEGHLSEVLKANGYKTKSSDLINRGYPDTEILDFLKVKKEDICNDFPRDIITNPPYKYAKEFVEKALEISMDSTKIAMFLKLTFLEGKARKILFKKYPPKTVYVFSSRVKCAKNGDFASIGSSAVAYAWFIWEKGFKGEPIIKWFN